MTWQDFTIKCIHELVPIITLVIGIHQPQPSYMKKDKP